MSIIKVRKYQIEPSQNIVAMNYKIVKSNMTAPICADHKKTGEVSHKLGNVFLQSGLQEEILLGRIINEFKELELYTFIQLYVLYQFIMSIKSNNKIQGRGASNGTKHFKIYFSLYFHSYRLKKCSVKFQLSYKEQYSDF